MAPCAAAACGESLPVQLSRDLTRGVAGSPKISEVAQRGLLALIRLKVRAVGRDTLPER